jgi:DNA-binding CsgD family transcriptional regulator
VAALVSAVRGRPATDTEVTQIHASSGGNPWLVGVLARGDASLTAVQGGLSLRLDRLERARPGSLAVLAALAPATRPLPHEVAAAVCDGDSAGLRRTLAALRDAGVLHEGDGGWQFRHDLLRRAVLDSMIAVERRDAHRNLAEALGASGLPTGSDSVSPLVTGDRASGSSRSGAGPAEQNEGRRGGPGAHAAEVAMHLAEAGDARAVPWALRAAEEARAVDAHAEALSQVERALSFPLAPDAQRDALRFAAEEAYALGRFADSRAFIDTAVAIPGPEPEALARLHQIGARSALMQADHAADEAHLAAAERALQGRPVTGQTLNIAVARVARAAVAIEPDRIALLAERARRVARELDDPRRATWAGAVIDRYLAVSRIECGDPRGFAMIDDLLHAAEAQRFPPDMLVNVLSGAYEEAVVGLFHDRAGALHALLDQVIERSRLGWIPFIRPYHVLELVQRARYDEARALAATVEPAPSTLEGMVLGCAMVMLEMRAGTPDRGREATDAVRPAAAFQQAALADLARLEPALSERSPDLGEFAQRVYGTMNRHRYARIAGVAAVALARSGRGAPVAPAWLVAGAPIAVFWDWAAGIVNADSAGLQAVSERLAAMGCPYEAALALGDGGDLRGSYLALRAINATAARERAAERLRASAGHIPRRRRSAQERGGLTETERQVSRLVATGASNETVATTLGVSVRTVESHLTSIYRKIGRRGRAALVAWWAGDDGTVRP